MSNKLTDIHSARPVTKAQVTNNDLFYIVDPEASTDAEKSKGIKAEELLKFTGGDVTNTGVGGTLTIGNDKVTRAMLAPELDKFEKVHLNDDGVPTTFILNRADHANKLLFLFNAEKMTLQIDSGVFENKDQFKVFVFGVGGVEITGSAVIVFPNGRDGTERSHTLNKTKSSLLFEFYNDNPFVTVFESHEEYTFASSEWSTYSGASPYLAADDKALVERADGNERKMTGRSIHNVETVTKTGASITIDSGKINQNMICTNAGSISATINHGDFKVGDWCTLLHTGAGTLTIQAAGSTVKIYSPGVTTSASHTITDRYGFVTILCFNDGTNDKFVLLGPVAEV